MNKAKNRVKFLMIIMVLCIGVVACEKQSYAAESVVEHSLKMQIEQVRSMLELQKEKQELIDNSAQITESAFREAAEYMGALEYDGRWQQMATDYLYGR